MFKRTQTQLTRQFSITIGVILLLTVFFAHWMVQYILTSTENNQLRSLSHQYAKDLQELLDSPKAAVLFDQNMNDKKLNEAFSPTGLQLNQMTWLVSAQGEILLQSPGGKNGSLIASEFPILPLLPSILSKPDDKYHNVRSDGRTFRIGGLTINASTGDEYRVIVAQEVTSDVALLVQLRWAFAGFALVMLLAGAAAGYLLAGRAMVPIFNAYRRQEQFTADASHELRTPLSILRSSVEVLNEQRETLPEFYRNVLAKSGKEIHHLIRLVDNLLTLARSENGRIEIMKRPFSLRSMVLQVLEQLEPIAQGKQVRLHLAESSQTVEREFCGDEVRIRQLTFILAENAIQYNRSGGTVTVAIESGPDEAAIMVTDTGIGIAKEHLTGIFERFYRLDQARTRRSEGTGLGLAIAKQIVLSHRGRLQVWSEPEVGTTFRVTMPNISD
ncbi:cell wall metabolism sensor histidine kinase WalK [Paenibacillus sp. CF384]|uniref:sensor histidine kinase n=1 Tax=Paenibacillus sp. CF384 TaxID=1884382 RepID=UPI00089C9B23|nr:ATP-binding protein [Paenibacillus sp. CF384]SDX13076.1 His Kinase A (phospho-acceptor) domain-containing protein [Paenibacillus sp. CF384]